MCRASLPAWQCAVSSRPAALLAAAAAEHGLPAALSAMPGDGARHLLVGRSGDKEGIIC